VDERLITVFYDGTCGLCHRAVQFLLRRDPDGQLFRYAPLQGTTASEVLGDLDRLPDSMVIQCEDGARLWKGRAALRIGSALGGLWWLLATIGRLLPTPVLDRMYDAIAARRYRWFGKREDHCPLMLPSQRSLFLD